MGLARPLIEAGSEDKWIDPDFAEPWLDVGE
jgi:hypothetical protein